MSVYGKRGFIYDNGDATAVTKGCAITRSSASTVKLATATTDFPLGVSLESMNRFDTISVETVRGEFVKAIASANLTAGEDVTCGSGGKFAASTKLAGTGIVVSASLEWVWGQVWDDPTADLDLFTLFLTPVEVEQ
jgi:hypothetical protein